MLLLAACWPPGLLAALHAAPAGSLLLPLVICPAAPAGIRSSVLLAGSFSSG
jgi:hypothetical protein